MPSLELFNKGYKEMSNIHYFQRYSGKENTVTNNLLLLISRIYAYSPKVCAKFFNEILGNINGIEIGLDIRQQEASDKSIPDGTIRQKSFSIQIEAKVDAPHNEDQLLRHLGAFKNEELKVLLLVTKSELPADLFGHYSHVLKEKSPDVQFCATTYEEICNSINELFKEYEIGMVDVVADFIEYCNDVKLFDQSKTLMRVPPCGASIHLNKKYGIYFQPDDRRYTNHSYIGAYANKSIQVIWKVRSVFDVVCVDGELKEKKRIHGDDCNDFDQSIIAIIKEAKIDCGYDIGSDHRFFCGTPYFTDFRKITPGGIQGACFIDLKGRVSNFDDVECIANELRNQTWE